MTDLQTYRELFPHTADCVYMNHAAVSPLSWRVRDAMEEYLKARSRYDIEYWPATMEVKNKFRSLAARLINAPVQNVAVSESTSMSLNWLAQGTQWKPGDRILLNDIEFPSNIYPFLNLQRQGVEIDYVKHRNGRIEAADIDEKILPRTRLLSISFVQYLSGFRADLAEIGRICRAHDVIFAVDGIQGVGVCRLDVQRMGIDFLACGTHKWLMSPMGVAFFYVSPRIFNRLQPMAAGWLSVKEPWREDGYHLDFLDDAGRYQPGNFNVCGTVGALASLQLFLELGPEAIEAAVLSISGYLMENLGARGFSLFTPPEPHRRAGIVTFSHPHSEALHQYLRENRVFISLRHGYLRIAPHFYNTTAEADRLLDLIDRFSTR